MCRNERTDDKRHGERTDRDRKTGQVRNDAKKKTFNWDRVEDDTKGLYTVGV